MSWNTEEELTRYEIRMCLWKTDWHLKTKVLASLAESGLGAKSDEVGALVQTASNLIKRAYRIMAEEEEKMMKKEGTE